MWPQNAIDQEPDARLPAECHCQVSTGKMQKEDRDRKGLVLLLSLEIACPRHERRQIQDLLFVFHFGESETGTYPHKLSTADQAIEEWRPRQSTDHQRHEKLYFVVVVAQLKG